MQTTLLLYIVLLLIGILVGKKKIGRRTGVSLDRKAANGVSDVAAVRDGDQLGDE